MRRPTATRQKIAALALLLTLPACGSADSTPPLFASLDLPVSITEFRLRINDFAENFVAVIEEAAEEVIDQAEDEDIRRNAMVWRLRTVNVFLNSLHQPDPIAALIDAWAFCLQLQEFVTEGPGKEMFGEQQRIVVAAVDRIVIDVENLVTTVAEGPAEEAHRLVYDWVDQHPVRDKLIIRMTSAVEIADQLESQDNSAFAALGRLQAGVDDIVTQYQRYISIMPRTIRWQTQLILHETLYDEPRVRRTLDDLDLITANLLEAFALLDELPDQVQADIRAMVADLEPFIEQERTRLIAEVDRQRGLIFADVGGQREAFMRDVDGQIALIDAQIQGRMDEVFDRVEALTEATVAESFSESERLIDLFYARTLVLLLIAIAGGAGLILLHKWRHPARLAPQARPDSSV